MRRLFSVLLFAGLLLTYGCATAQKLLPTYQSGAVVETLSANASLSISKGDQGMGSNGYLLYQRPDRVRLVVLSPFGTTLLEAIMIGNRITIIDNSKGIAFSGDLNELSHEGMGQTWRHARWTMDMDPPGSLTGDGLLERVNSMGNKEQVTFTNGVVVSKVQANGDMVRYLEHELVNGVPLATEIIMDSHDGGRLRIKITEPEVNVALAADAFSVRLEGLKTYPLSALQVP
jgi:outer membrane lipoprotein-sorting protein